MNTLWQQLRLMNKGARSVTLWAHLGLAAGFTAVFAISLLVVGATQYVQTQLLGDLPDQEIRVTTRKQDMAMFRMPDPDAKQAFSSIDLDNLRAVPGVQQVYPISYANQPAELNVNMLGQGITTDIVIQGVDPAWIAQDVPDLDWQTAGKALPVVVNTQLLAIYNNGYAPAQGFPQLSEQALKVPALTLRYGREPLRVGQQEPLRIKAKVAGMSPRVALGLAVPREKLNTWHQQLGLKPPPITEAILQLARQADLAVVHQAVNDLGFTPDPPNPLANALRRLERLGIWGGALLMIAVGLFGSAYLNQTLNLVFLAKRRDYAVCRAMGMSRQRLRHILLSESMSLVGLDLFMGLTLGWLAAQGTLGFINPWLTDYLGAPLQLQLPRMPLVFLIVAVLAVALVTVLPRIWRLTATPPGQLLD